MKHKPNDLPAYIHCDDCGERHYLSLNRDVQGRWSIGYVDFAGGEAIHGMNGFKSINDALKAMKLELKIEALQNLPQDTP